METLVEKQYFASIFFIADTLANVGSMGIKYFPIIRCLHFEDIPLILEKIILTSHYQYSQCKVYISVT